MSDVTTAISALGAAAGFAAAVAGIMGIITAVLKTREELRKKANNFLHEVNNELFPGNDDIHEEWGTKILFVHPNIVNFPKYKELLLEFKRCPVSAPFCKKFRNNLLKKLKRMYFMLHDVRIVCLEFQQQTYIPNDFVVLGNNQQPKRLHEESFLIRLLQHSSPDLYTFAHFHPKMIEFRKLNYELRKELGWNSSVTANLYSDTELVRDRHSWWSSL